ncbi:MAG TPA: adenylate/guanylate cyclase domain-containing protein [Cyclobacteriaceae bacterium]|nr:adenylate/guanylate cyclase domain-containing protein [Cyclobacteriaceae bacterium]
MKNRFLSGIVIGILITALLSVGIFAEAFSGLNLKFKDSLYTKNDPSEEIIIVAIDDKSTEQNALGRFNQWPRSNYAKVLKNIEAGNPSVVAFDLVFHTRTASINKDSLEALKQSVDAETDSKEKLKLYNSFIAEYTDPFSDPDDQQFVEALSGSSNVILAGMYLAHDVPIIKALTDFYSHSEVGIITNPLDEDGVIRRSTPYFYVDWNDQPYEDFGLKAAKLHTGKESFNLPLENDNLLVNFFGDPYSFKMVSFVDVVNGDVPDGIFYNKIVLVGATSSKEMHDEFITPKSNVVPMPGVEYRANEIQTILSGDFLRNQTKVEVLILVLFLAIFVTVMLNYLSIFISTVGGLSLIALYIFLAHTFYAQGILLDMVYPFIAIVLSYLGSWVYRYFVADKSKREIKSAFGHYVSEDLVDEISKHPEQVKLGGEKRELTIFFSDIKDSTSYSEKIATEEWVSQINEYFTVMEMIIKKYRGTVDKYEGDAIMAFWNAPLLEENHTELCYSAALEMQKSLRLLHEKWQKEGKPLIEIRIGINTGESIIGNFGSEGRFDYTAMGDTVNTASRLESSANKTYGTHLIAAKSKGGIPPETLNKFLVREIDNVLLSGKSDAVTLYELIARIEEATGDQKALVTAYSQALQAYRAKDFLKASEGFKSLVDDGPSKVMMERCNILSQGQKIPELSEELIYKILNK